MVARNNEIRQLATPAKFAMVGGACFVLNIFILFVCTTLLRFHYAISLTISFVVCGVIGWFLNRQKTFGSRASYKTELRRYMLTNALTSAFSYAVMVTFVTVLGLHYLTASATVSAAMFLVNFRIHKRFTFRDETAIASRKSP